MPDINLRISRDRFVTYKVDKTRVSPLPVLDRSSFSSMTESGYYDEGEDIRIQGTINKLGENTLNSILSFTQDAIKDVSAFSQRPTQSLANQA